MSSFTHPIIVPFDFDVEDAFSSTQSPDYTPASLDYFLALLSQLHREILLLYLRMALIDPPPVLPQSPVLSLSLIFDPRDFFIPEEILPPRERSHFRSSSSTNPPAQPQAIEIGENFHGTPNTSYARHEEQNRRQETVRAYATTPTENKRYTGNLPLCTRCTLHHTGFCTVKCQTCNKVGHLTRDCRNKGHISPNITQSSN
ncbi:putative reverse transcriptase domain-containing protein [Tanacetum coccineum]